MTESHATSHARARPRTLLRRARVLTPLLGLAILLAACGDTAPGVAEATGLGPVGTAATPSALSGDPRVPAASGDTHAELCRSIAEVDSRLTTMRAVELRVTNRVALEIELGQLQVAIRELQDANLGTLEEELETPLTRIGYRLQEVELAVEDFRTNSRPQRAVPHVEEDTQTFADELTAFTILARC